MTDVERIAECFVELVEDVEPFGSGHINDTYLVRSAGDDVVLQRVNRAVFNDVEGLTANIITVHGHLGGELVPDPVPARDGAWVLHDGSDAWRAWRRVPNAEPARMHTAEQGTAAGRLLARFHAGLVDLDPARLTTTLPGFHDPGRRLAALRAAVDADPFGRAQTVEDEIATAFASSLLVERAEEITRHVPRRVAHNDAKLDNVLFRDDEAVCLVDLDTLMPGAWFWDVGDLLRTAGTTTAEDDAAPEHPGVRPALYQAVLDAYTDGISGVATAAELEALEVAGAIVTYEQAVRFLTDWLAGDVYYRTSRPDQNRDRARAQFRLLASMPGTVTAP